MWIKKLKLAFVIHYPWFLASVYIGSFSITVLVQYYLSIPVGVAIYLAILISLILQSTLHWNKAQQDFYLVLGLVPLIGIVSIGVLRSELTKINLVYPYWSTGVAKHLHCSATSKVRCNDSGFNGMDCSIYHYF